MTTLNDKLDDMFVMDAGKLGNAIMEPLTRIREADPIYWSQQSQCWLVTRHEDVILGLSGELPLSAKRLNLFAFGVLSPEERKTHIPTLELYTRDWLVNIDAPQHTRLRKLMVRAFSRKVVEGIRPFVLETVAGLMEHIKIAKQHEVEFVEDIARRLPASVILKLIGFPLSNLPHMKDWANGLIGAVGRGFGPLEVLQEAERVTMHMANVARAEIATRQANPGPVSDILDELIAMQNEDKLSEDEMISMLVLLVVAGHDTTSNSMVLMMLVLAEHPEAWEFMYNNPEKMPGCVDELMRYIAMSFMTPRIASEDFVWHGKEIKQGQILMMVQAMANRDPRAYSNPEALDLQRSNMRVTTFAPGQHHCLGHLLAKMQLAEFLTALVNEFSGLDILDDDLSFMPQIGFRGLLDLNVRFIPRQPS